MFFRALLFLFLLSVGAQAYTIDVNSTTVYKKDFGIYVYGDVESIENAFILVKAIAESDQLDIIIALIAAFFLPYAGYQFFTTGSGRQLSLNMTYVIGSILFINTDGGMPYATMHIEDLRTETNYAGLPARTYAQVDGIPYPIALLTSSVSTITDSLTLLYEDAIALIHPDLSGASSVSVGFGNAIGDMLKILTSAELNKLNDANTTQFSRSLTAYTEQCGLKHALANNPDLITNFKNPNKDIFKAIDPTSLGITGVAYTLTFTDSMSGEQVYQCDAFWNNNIISKYPEVAEKLKERLNKVTVGNINSSSIVKSAIALGADINDTVIASEVGKFHAYILNLGAHAPVSKAFSNAAMDISTGQDLANSITAGVSMAEMQMEGIGRMKWMAEVIPYGFHFMLGVIYSISILIMIVATAIGATKGFMIWKNFAKGLMTFEFIKISLVIINASVNQYAYHHAADFLASIGQNPATIDSLPYYYHYLANMAGIAGILGITAIFMIPAMVFSGEVGMAAGAISGLAGRYKGNDARTATDVSAEQKAKQAQWEKEIQDQAMLDYMGVSVPTGMGASEFYAQYQRGATAAGQAWGAQRMGTSAMDSAGVGAKGQTMQSISSMGTLGNSTPMSDFVSAGVVQGSQMAGQVKGQSAGLRDFGAEDIEISAKLGGYTQVAESVTMTKARQNAGLANQEGTLTGLGMTSMERKMGMDAAGMAGLGRAEYKDKDGKTIEDQEAFALRARASAGQSAEAPIKDAAYINQAMSGNGLNQQYAMGLSLSEEGKLAGVRGLGSLNAGDQARYIAASENQGMMKAQQSIGDTEGAMKQYGDEAKRAGKDLADVIKDVANTVSQAKTGSTIGGINKVGAEAYIANQVTKAMSDSGALDTGIKVAGGREGYIALNSNKALIDTAMSVGTTTEKIKQINDGSSQKALSDLQAQGASLEEFKNADGTWKSGAEYLKAVGASQARKQTMKESIVDDTGKTIDFAMGVDGTVNKMSMDGAMVINDGKKVDTRNVENHGSSFTNEQDRLQKTIAFNMHQVAHGKSDKQIKYDKVTGSFAMPDKETGQEFKDFVGNADLVSQTLKNVTSETLGEVADALGMSPTAVVGTVGGAALALGGTALGKRLGTGNKPIVDKAGNKGGNSASDHIDSQHDKTPLDNIRNYTENYGESKAKLDTEARNLQGLEEQRANLKDGDPRASRLDNQIEESKSKMAGHQHDMDVADRNIKATKHLASHNTPDVPKGGALKSVAKGAAGGLAFTVATLADELGVDPLSNAGIALGSIADTAETVGDATMAAFDILGGTIRGGARLFTGGDAKGALSEGLSAAASRVTSGWKQREENFNEIRRAALSEVPSQGGAPLTMQAMQNDPGLPAAIDAHNTQSNLNSMQNVGTGRIVTMQSRAGEVAFDKNAKTGNLMVQIPDQAFPVQTQIPFEQFQNSLNDPSQAQQFAQMVAQSSLDLNNGANMQQAQHFEQLRNEMSASFTQSSFKNLQISNQVGNTRMMVEEVGETMKEDFATQLEDISSDITTIGKQVNKHI